MVRSEEVGSHCTGRYHQQPLIIIKILTKRPITTHLTTVILQTELTYHPQALLQLRCKQFLYQQTVQYQLLDLVTALSPILHANVHFLFPQL